MFNNHIYMDYQSAKPVDSEVVKTMNDFHLNRWGNPSSLHKIGDDATEMLESSRETIANWIENIRAQQERYAPYTMYVPGGGCGFHGTYGMMGLKLFCLAIYDARDAMEKLLWANNENSVRLAEAAAKANL